MDKIEGTKFILSDSTSKSLSVNKYDDAYKAFFASLFKIKDKDVQRRVLQAVNGQNVTCANCGHIISTVRKPETHSPQKILRKSIGSTQTLDTDFETVERMNNMPKKNLIRTNEYIGLNKIQLGRAKRKCEPYAVKKDPKRTCNRQSLLINSPCNRLLNRTEKPKPIVEPTYQRKPSITAKLLSENHINLLMSAEDLSNIKPDEVPGKYNDMIFFTTMEEELRTAGRCNDGGLYPIHIATIEGDLFKMKRLLLIYKYKNWDINVRSKEGRKESALHYAVSSCNYEAINLLLDMDADVLATNDVGDTVLHFAAETLLDFPMIKKFFSKICIDDLNKRNDKSQTILHAAAIQKNRKFIKSILHIIDQKFNISSVGDDIPFDDTANFFKKLDTLHISYVKTFIKENFVKPSIHPIKANILNQRDGRSGRTALFLSLCNNDVSTCMMLIAHFADTRIRDFSGTTCAAYSTEDLKNRILAQAIYNADSMHNSVIFKTLKHPERQRSVEDNKRMLLDPNDNDDIMAKVTKALS